MTQLYAYTAKMCSKNCECVIMQVTNGALISARKRTKRVWRPGKISSLQTLSHGIAEKILNGVIVTRLLNEQSYTIYFQWPSVITQGHFCYLLSKLVGLTFQ